MNCLCECRHSVDNYTYSSVSIDDGSSWLTGQLIGHCCIWDFCVNVCCVFSFIYIYIYIILLLKTAQNMFKNEHNGAWFGVIVLWSVIMAYTIVSTLARSGADDAWQFGVYKNICCFTVVKLLDFLKKNRNKEFIDILFIYWFVCFKMFLYREEISSFTDHKCYQIKVTYCNFPNPWSVLNKKTFLPTKLFESDPDATSIIPKWVKKLLEGMTLWLVQLTQPVRATSSWCYQ